MYIRIRKAGQVPPLAHRPSGGVAGLDVVTNTVANVTKIVALVAKISVAVAKIVI